VEGPDTRRKHDAAKARGVSMRLLGNGPPCEGGTCPAIWDDGETLVVQGWRVEDDDALAEIGVIPPGETVVRIPKRLLSVLSEIT
jgi:hypothetical protein